MTAHNMKKRTQYDYWDVCLKVNKRDVETRRTGSTKRHMEYLSLQDRLRIKAADILKSQGKLLFQKQSEREHEHRI